MNVFGYVYYKRYRKIYYVNNVKTDILKRMKYFVIKDHHKIDRIYHANI